ncbi:MAG: hypothetical protein H5T76_04635, partial [Streptomyces sp.]|nr:hypothetical protein [Streptomyces sp.]
MRSPRTAPGRRTRVLLAVVCAAGVLTGCQTLADAALDAGCEGTESRVAKLGSYRVLDSRPRGTVVPRGFEDLDSGCWADSGEAWLYAERTYVFPGGRAEVVRHYRRAAERDGWRPSGVAT